MRRTWWFAAILMAVVLSGFRDGPAPTSAQVPPSLTINDVTMAEGNAGTVAFMFTVSLSAPAVPGDGVDLVNPDLDNLFDTAAPAERYSFTFDGDAQSLQHVLAGAPLLAATTSARIEYARINAGFPETSRNDTTSALRLSDNDPVVAYFAVQLPSVDLTLLKTASPDPVLPDADLVYTIMLANEGPDSATTVTLSDSLPAGTTFVSLASPPGFSCMTPVPGATGTVSCTIASFAPGGEVFTLTVHVDPGLAEGTIISNTATVTSATADRDPGNESATASTTVSSVSPVPLDLGLTKTDGLTEVAGGQAVTYTIVVTNHSDSSATTAFVTDTFPATLTGCTWTAALGRGATGNTAGSGNIMETITLLGLDATITYTVTCHVDVSAVGTITNTASVAPPSGVSDTNSSNDSASDTDNVIPRTELSVTKTADRSLAPPGSTVTYTIVVANAGPATATGASVADNFPPELTGCSWPAPIASGAATGGTAGAGDLLQVVTLPAESSLTYTVSCMIPPATTSSSATNTATVTPPAGSIDPTLPNSATVILLIVFPLRYPPLPPWVIEQQRQQADLGIGGGGRAQRDRRIGAGSYDFTIENHGPLDATGVEVAIEMPAGLEVLRSTLPAGCRVTGMGPGGGTLVKCGIALLRAGESIMLSIAVYGSGPYPPFLHVGVSSATPDLNPSNDEI